MAPRTRLDPDYYAILGVPPEATAEEIRKAYRRLALRWHPDRNAGDPRSAERFKELSEAYAVLVDPARRREYDRARMTGAPYDVGRSREDLFRDLFADPAASAVFEELAREFERMGMRVDRHYFRHTLFGGRAVVTGGVFIVTPLTPVLALFRFARAALRARPDAPARSMPLPGPRGVLRGLTRAGRWLLGLPAGPGDTPAAPGEPDLVLPLRLTRAEATGGGARRVVVARDGARDELLVRIPPGVETGTRLRLRGKGRVFPGQLPGDAYLVVELVD